MLVVSYLTPAALTVGEFLIVVVNPVAGIPVLGRA